MVQQRVQIARLHLVRVVIEDIDDAPAARVILRMRQHRRAAARPREQDPSRRCAYAVSNLAAIV